MSAVWLCVLVVGLATVALKAAGPVLAAGRELPAGAARVVDLLAPALLAALVATQAFASDEELVLDERAAGLLAAGVAIAAEGAAARGGARGRGHRRRPEGRRVSARGWALFAAVSVIWGMPYLFIKIAVDEISPSLVAWSRLALAAAGPAAARLEARRAARARRALAHPHRLRRRRDGGAVAAARLRRGAHQLVARRDPGRDRAAVRRAPGHALRPLGAAHASRASSAC